MVAAGMLLHDSQRVIKRYVSALMTYSTSQNSKMPIGKRLVSDTCIYAFNVDQYQSSKRSSSRYVGMCMLNSLLCSLGLSF